MMSVSESAARILCLASVGAVLAFAGFLIYKTDRQPCKCRSYPDDALVAAIVEATREMDELASTIADAEHFEDVLKQLEVVRGELSGVRLGSRLVYPLIFKRVRGDYAQGMENLPGVRLEEGHVTQLKLLVGELETHCRTYDMPIFLEVYGFSSEVNFREVEVGTSNTLNLEAANARAKNVRQKLNELIEDAPKLTCKVSVQQCVWSEDSFRRPYFFDEKHFHWKLQEVMGRTVFVRPARDGTCDGLVAEQ